MATKVPENNVIVISNIQFDCHNGVIWRRYDSILLNLLAKSKCPSKKP